MTTERAYFGYENSLVERLRQLEPSNPAHQRHVGHEAADEIERLRSDNERLKEWCRKLIEGGTFPGEADNLRSLNAELVAALEEIANLALLPMVDMTDPPEQQASDWSDVAERAWRTARTVLAKVKEGK